MILQKTPKARSAIEMRTGELAVDERRIVILANGKRSASELAMMLGDAVHETLWRLIDHGYLEFATTPAIPGGTPPAANSGQIRPSAANPQPLAPGRASDRSSPPPDTAGRIETGSAPEDLGRGALGLYRQAPRRRSLAATKMYIVDMLQLLRSPEASALSVAIHTCGSDDQLLEDILEALRFIDQRSGRDYALKVQNQLLATIPEAYLPRLSEALTRSKSAVHSNTFNQTAV